MYLIIISDRYGLVFSISPVFTSVRNSFHAERIALLENVVIKKRVCAYNGGSSRLH